MITPESVRAFLPGSFPGDLGLEPLDIEDSHARGRIVADRRHLHPGGFIHGGVWTALGDTVAAWATFRVIPPRRNFTTIELKRLERRREGTEPRLAANLIVSQFVLPPRD
jgi:acyl-coenzyme A thioesterase PaaI-like protein